MERGSRVNLIADYARAARILAQFIPGDRVFITAIESEGKESVVFNDWVSMKDLEETLRRFNNPNRRCNVYFVVNSEFLTGTRNKANIEAVRYVYVDADGKDYGGTIEQGMDYHLTALTDKRPKGLPAPSSIWFTGGGYQALWRLDESVTVEQGEALNEAIAHAIHASPCTKDASRLFRVPETVNWLNKKKRDAERKPKISEMLQPQDYQRPLTAYPVSAFDLPRPEPKQRELSLTPADPPENIKPVALDQPLSELLAHDTDWLAAVVLGQAPDGKQYESRSELLLAVCVRLLGNGIEPGQVLSIITDRNNKISAHIYERAGNPLKYAERQVQKAKKYIQERFLNWPVLDLKGRPMANSADNIRYGLDHIGVTARHNEFTGEDSLVGGELDGRDWKDATRIIISVFERKLRFRANLEGVLRELKALAHEARYNPPLDHINSLVWDGKPRLDRLLIDYCNAEDTALNQQIAAITLIGAVKRLRQPGCQHDTMLILEGPQGCGKSTFVRILAIEDDWFCETFNLGMQDRELAMLMRRAFIVECQELVGLGKKDSESLKNLLSARFDTYRKPYGEAPIYVARHGIIIGTTNRSEYLRDTTGNRRFLPVQVGQVDLKQLRSDIDQIWAEAAHREAQGEPNVMPENLYEEAAHIQEKRLMEDPYEDLLTQHFANEEGQVSVEAIKALLGLQTTRMTSFDAQRIKDIMLALGWQHGTYSFGEGKDRKQAKGFSRGNKPYRKWSAHYSEHGRYINGSWPIHDR